MHRCDASGARGRRVEENEISAYLAHCLYNHPLFHIEKKKTVAHATTAAPPLLPLLHALEWLTVLLRGYVRPYRQYGEGAPVIRSPPKVFTKHKYVYVIPATSPYYNNPQALFNLYKPVHTPQPTHTLRAPWRTQQQQLLLSFPFSML